MLSVKQGSIKYHFLSLFFLLNQGLEPDLPGHARTVYSLGQWLGKIRKKNKNLMKINYASVLDKKTKKSKKQKEIQNRGYSFKN